ncbi:sulfate/molybdate ABC transporter ATP-binding protein [Azospirillum sp. A39]|uniref:sulfate/molybdate ABC transporter ATP-binding protein n=1 Tax=Azospirillum sp. A39 TaxID=3462279 RepID=UPI0040465AD3
MTIALSGITKRFGDVVALDGIGLEVRGGELLALLGPSGSGKTTLLRIIAGLDRPDAGRLEIQGEDALDRAPRDRRVGFVFQHYALFRHMTVAGNVAFGLDVLPARERPPRAEIRRRVADLLERVQLGPLADRYPAQLSGGQRQRVALARALVVRPSILLLDEPFGALDAKVRKELRRWLRRLHDEMHITSVFVTHDQEEALELADRIAVVNRGAIEQVGTPAEVYDHPASAFVCEFLGPVNRLEGTVAGDVLRLAGGALAVPLAQTAGERPAAGPALAFARPHDVLPVADPQGPARLLGLRVVGAAARLDLDLAGQAIEAEIDRTALATLALAAGDRCTLRFARLRVFPGA